MTIYDFAAKTIDGEQRALRDYSGKVLLVVNMVARFAPPTAPVSEQIVAAIEAKL